MDEDKSNVCMYNIITQSCLKICHYKNYAIPSIVWLTLANQGS